jgi:hypothetical protein
MVFGSFTSKQAYLSLNDAIAKERQRRKDAVRAQKIIGDYNYKSGKPFAVAQTVAKNATAEATHATEEIAKHEPLALQDISLMLHRIMNPKDAIAALHFLASKRLVAKFDQYKDIFLRRFRGQKRIDLHEFEKFWTTYEFVVQRDIVPTQTAEFQATEEPAPDVIRRELPTVQRLDAMFEGIDDPEQWLTTIVQNFTHARRKGAHNVFVWDGGYYANGHPKGFSVRGRSPQLRMPSAETDAYQVFRRDKQKYYEEMIRLNFLRHEASTPTVGIADASPTNSTYATPEGSPRGTGLIRLAPPHVSKRARYHPLGEKFISKKRLDEGILSVYHPAGGMVAPRRAITPELMRLLKEMIYNDRFDEPMYRELPMADKKIFDELVQQTKLQYDTRFKLHAYKNPVQLLREEYNKLTGEMNIGNDNPDIRKKLKSVVVELFMNKVLGEADFKRLIEELY